MYNIAKLDKNEKIVIFQNTSTKKNIDVNIIEKDFYVCLILDYLFDKCKYKDFFHLKVEQVYQRHIK